MENEINLSVTSGLKDHCKDFLVKWNLDVPNSLPAEAVLEKEQESQLKDPNEVKIKEEYEEGEEANDTGDVVTLSKDIGCSYPIKEETDCTSESDKFISPYIKEEKVAYSEINNIKIEKGPDAENESSDLVVLSTQERHYFSSGSEICIKTEIKSEPESSDGGYLPLLPKSDIKIENVKIESESASEDLEEFTNSISFSSSDAFGFSSGCESSLHVGIRPRLRPNVPSDSEYMDADDPDYQEPSFEDLLLDIEMVTCEEAGPSALTSQPQSARAAKRQAQIKLKDYPGRDAEELYSGHNPEVDERTVNHQEFQRYKEMGFPLRKCSVKISCMSENLLAKYGVTLDDFQAFPEEKVDLETLKKGCFSCRICGFRSNSLAAVHKHRKNIHEGPLQFRCMECDYSARWAQTLSNHIRCVHRKEKRFKCPYCDHVAFSFQHVKCHLRTHTGEKPYRCPNCMYRCATGQALKIHMYTHTGEKPFACPHCSYRCTQHQHLKSHLRVHTKEKPFACQLCEYKTTQSTHLRSHIQVMHTDIKPYKCEFCDFVCKGAHTLKYHRRRHTGEKPYVCKLCPFRCAQSSPYRLHMMGHNQKMAFACPHCCFTAVSKRTIDNHVVRWHPRSLSTEQTDKDFKVPDLAAAKAAKSGKAYKTRPVKRYRCKECNFTSMIRPTIVDHIVEAHSNALCPIED